MEEYREQAKGWGGLVPGKMWVDNSYQPTFTTVSTTPATSYTMTTFSQPQTIKFNQ